MQNYLKNISFLLPLVILILCGNSSNAGIVIVNGLTHQHNLAKGELAKDIIIVKNTGSTPEKVVLYQRDFSFNYKGETSYGEIGENPRSNANWMIINPLSFIIEPNQETEVAYELRIPDNDSIYGSYWSVVMVEPAADLDTNRTKLQVSINSVLRYAVQIVANIESTTDSIAKRDLEFLDVEIVKENKVNYLVIDAENKGDLMLKTTMNIEIFDDTGESIGIYSSKPGRTYPSTSRRFIVKLPEMKNGSFQSILVADSGSDEILGVQLTLEISDD